MNMKRHFYLLCCFLGIALAMQAQTTEPKPEAKEAKTAEKEKKTPLFGIGFSGFVKTDLIFDSRQTVSAREGHFLLFPENEKLDADGNDIHAKANFNILSIQTRLAGTITGPDALGAKTSGYIEAEFFGNINPNINTFRLRHAWVKLAWSKTELLVGQWWHPMFVPECAPATISFNTGAPFVVFSRNPQIKLTQRFGNLKLALTFLSQIDFTSDGPDGPNPKYLRNSVLPESDFQIQYVLKNASKGIEFMIGAGVNFQLLTPRLATTKIVKPAYDTVINNKPVHYDAVTQTYKTDTKSPAMAYNLYSKLVLRNFTVKIGGEYGGNNNAYTMLGGFAQKSVTNADKNLVDYANIRSFAAWAEIHTNAVRWQPGLFLAYGKNLGASGAITGPYYARGANIDYAYRISPRIFFNVNKFRLAGELEYTVAAYGKTNGKGYVYDAREIGNIRLLIGVYYFF
jgi:hypothetical protein